MKTQVQSYLSLAAFSVVVLDGIASFPSEYRHIWSKKFTLTKCMYIISRYGAFASLIVHNVFVHIFLVRGPVPTSICRGWFLFLAASCTILHTSLLAVLMLQVWAVYRKNTKLIGGLIALVVLPFVVSFEIIGRNVVRNHHFNFNERCELRHTPMEAAPLAAVYLMSHLVLWVLIFRKRNDVMSNDRRLMSAVVSGGNISFIVLATLVGVMIPYCFITRSVDMILIFIVPMVPISKLYCKMVLDMFRSKTDPPTRFLDTTDIVLTYIFAPSFESHELPSRASDLP